MNKILRGQWTAAFAAALVFGLLAAGAFGASRSEQLREHFDEGLHHYQRGRTEEAKEAFAKMAEMNPTPAEAYELREAVGRSQMVAMMAQEEFREEILAILRLSYEHFEKLRRDAEKIEEYVKDLEDEDSRVVWSAIYSLQRIGPLAVPHLLDLIASPEPPRAESPAIPARIVLKNMGTRATKPLVQALKANTQAESAEEQREAERRDLHLKMEICRLLAASPDVRAVAPLMAVIESPKTNPLVREQAQKTLRAMEKEKRSASAAYLDLAEMYFDKAPRVVDVVSTFDRIVWRWREGAGKTYRERLTHEIPPDFLYPPMMAQQTMLDAMAEGHAQPALMALYAANNYMMLHLARRTAEAEEATEEERQEAAAQAERFAYVRELNEQLGARYLYLALDRALTDRDKALALDCISGLRAVGDPRPMPESMAAFRALTSRYFAVRTAAAEAIVSASPRGRIHTRRPQDRQEGGEVLANPSPKAEGNADEKAKAAKEEAPEEAPEARTRTERDANLVVGALYELLTVGGRPRVLVVTGRRQLYDEAAEILKGHGYQTELALESTAGIQRIKRPIPTIHAVLADAEAEPDLLLYFIRRDIRTARKPIVLLAPEDQTDEATEAYDAPAVAYTQELGILPTALRETMDAALDENGLPEIEVDAEQVKQALRTLLDSPTATEAYPLDKIVPALVAVVFEHGGEIGVMSLGMLARIEDQRAYEPAMQVFLDEDKDEALRVAAGRVVNRLIWRAPQPKEAQLEALEAMAAGEPGDLRDLAVRAIAKADLDAEIHRRTAVRAAEKHLWQE